MKDTELCGLGGWLALFGLGLILSVPFNTYFAYSTASALNSGAYNNWIVPGALSYHRLAYPALIGEVIVAALLGLASAGTLVLYALRRPTFRSAAVALLSANALAIFADSVLASMIRPDWRGILITKLFVVVPLTLLWIWYFFSSKRVRNTFNLD